MDFAAGALAVFGADKGLSEDSFAGSWGFERAFSAWILPVLSELLGIWLSGGEEVWGDCRLDKGGVAGYPL